VQILSEEKPSDTQRSGELRFDFMPDLILGSHSKFWVLYKEFRGYLKGSAGLRLQEMC
jgi:hypothetical protein